MKIFYFDCFAGISGDMTLGALVDLGVDSEYLIDELNKLAISDEFEIKVYRADKMGITGTKVDVILKNNDENNHHDHHDHHHHDDNYNHSHHHDHNHHTHSHDHHHRNLTDIKEQ